MNQGPPVSVGVLLLLFGLCWLHNSFTWQIGGALLRDCGVVHFDRTPFYQLSANCSLLDHVDGIQEGGVSFMTTKDLE